MVTVQRRVEDYLYTPTVEDLEKRHNPLEAYRGRDGPFTISCTNKTTVLDSFTCSLHFVHFYLGN